MLLFKEKAKMTHVRTHANTSSVADLKPLTSLRFFAAMMIVAWHANNSFSWPIIRSLPDTLVHGVSFFFVLSGFILTHVYTSKPFPGYRQFMLARWARLWPSHIIMIVLLVSFVAPGSITFEGTGFFNKWVTLGFHVTLTQALVPFVFYLFSWNGVSWSISTEMFFYLAFPFLLKRIETTWPWKLGVSALLVVMFYGGCRFLELPITGDLTELTVYSATYANPLTRGFEFCLGMSAWVLWSRVVRNTELSTLRWSLIETILIIGLILWLWNGYYVARSSTENRYIVEYMKNSGSSWIFAIVIIALASGRGLVGKLLSFRALVYLGEVSFAIYMVHSILLKVIVTRLPNFHPSVFEFLALLLVAASILHFAVELPAQKLIRSSWAARRAEGPITS